MPIPIFKFKNLTRTDLLQFDGVNFVNIPVYAVGKNVIWGPEGVGYNSLIIGDTTKNISLVGHKHTTDDILGLQELINDLGVNSNSGTNIDLSNYLLTSTFIAHLNNIDSAKHVTQAHLDKLNTLNNYWQLDEQGNLYTTYNAYSTQELSAWKNGDYSGFTFSLETAADVELSGLVTDDLLKYNGTKWVNVPMSSLVTGGTEYILPTASATTLGGIKVGNGLTISSGVLSVVGGGSTVEWGALTDGYRQLTVEGVTYGLAQSTHKHLWADITDKPSTFAPSAHTHAASDISSGTFAIARIPTGTTGSTVAIGNHLHTGIYEPVFTKNTAFNKNFGTTAGTVAEGNHTHTFASLAAKPTTLNGYGITDFTSHKNSNPIDVENTEVNAIGYANGVSLFGEINGGLLNMAYDSTWQSQIFQDFRTGQIALRGKNNGTWTSWRTVWDSGNLTNLNQLTTRNFSDLQNKPTTLGGYGITDAVTTNTPQTISGVKTFSANLTASTSVTTPKVIFNTAGWSMEQVGSELQMKHNNVLKMRFTSTGSIIATEEITAFG